MKNIFYIFFSLCLLILINKNTNSQTWTDQVLGYNNYLQSVSTVNNTCVWISGLGGLVLKTTNGGTNWINVGNKKPIDSQNVISIYSINENVSLVITGYYDSNNISHFYVFRTSNSGENWYSVFNQNNGYLDAISFKDSVNGFLLGDPVSGRWSLWKSTDAGITWDSTGLYLSMAGGQDASYDNDLTMNGDSIWFGTSNNRVYYSLNFGNNWNFGTTNCPLIYTVTMNGNIGFATESCAFKTTDAGYHWNQVNLSHSFAITSFTHIDNKFWYAFDDSIYYSSDGGNNFIFQHALPSLDFIWQISMKKVNNQIVGWAVAQYGRIAKYTAPIGIVPISSEVPNKYNLYQNYPNPFNPATKIKYQIARSGDVKLIIYDITGKEVGVLVNEKQSPGVYEAEFNSNNYASGVYFYKLETESFSETKKMVLLK